MDTQALQQPELRHVFRQSGIEFSGKPMEYFRIWIVNLFLSIITLGIYSAWAKVRNTQYLYGHTKAEGHGLRYLAKPMQILKGRIIAFVFFALYAVSGSINPLLSAILGIVLIFAMPWLLIQGLKFTLQHTSYRNVRFSFTGTYGQSFKHFILLPMVGALTLYLAMPWVLKKMDQFLRGKVSYGGQPFDLETSTGTYYLASIASVITSIVVFGVLFGVLNAFAPVMLEMQQVDMEFSPQAGPLMAIATMAIFFIGTAIIRAIYTSIIRNHVFNRLNIRDTVAFESRVKILPYTWLLASNAVLVVITLGLAFPITVIRKNRYLASVTDVKLTDKADHLVDAVNADPSAFGEEAAGLFDVDLSLT